MKFSGLNSYDIKMINRSRILRLLNNQGAMSRKDIAKELGLTPAAVTQITSDFLESGLLKEVGEAQEEKRVGRRKILLRLDESYAYILTICIESDLTTIGIGNLRGDCLRKRQMRTNINQNAEAFFRGVTYEAKLLIWDMKLEQAHFLGAGVSIPGRVKRKTGTSQRTFVGWDEDVPVQRILEEHLEMPVIVENNVRAYAEAELAFGVGRQSDNLFFVKWSPGVGSAVVVRNKIYENSSEQSSELGHIRIRMKGGKPCHCGRRGCLETEVSVAALTEKVREKCRKETMPQLFKYCNGKVDLLREDSFMDWCRLEEPAMQEIFRESIRMLAVGLAGATTSLIPDHLIYYGELFHLDFFRKTFEEEYRELVEPYFREDFLVYSPLSEKIDYIGPLAMVYNEQLLLKLDRKD